MKSKLTLKLLSLLGFSGVAASCNVVGPDMYGCPPLMEHQFDVEVKDAETGTPIQGIRVAKVIRLEEKRYNPLTGNYESTGNIRTDTLDRSLTSETGKATLKFYTETLYDPHEIVADDIDGDQNGGKFESTSVEVNLNTEAGKTDVVIDLNRE